MSRRITSCITNKFNLLVEREAQKPLSHGGFLPVISSIMAFTMMISPAVYAETIITNTATANFSINGTNQQLSDSTQFTKDEIVTPPDSITLEKLSSSSNAEIGDTVDFTIRVENPNDHELTNVNITDTLPTGLLYKDLSARLNNNLLNASNVTYSSNDLQLTLGNIPANSIWSVDYKVTVSSTTPAGSAINQARVISDTAVSTVSQATVNISLAPPADPLLLEKSADTSAAKIGDVIRYSLNIRNNNTYEIDNIRIEDTLPSGVQYQIGSTVLNGPAINEVVITADTNNGLVFPLGNIPANTVWTLQYNAKIEQNIESLSLVNLAQVTADDSNANSATAQVNVDVINDNIILTKQANVDNANIDDVITYTVSVNNPAQHSLQNLVLQDMLPVGFIYESGSARIDSQPITANNIQVSGRSLQIKVASLDIGATLTITYKVKVTANAESGNAINQIQANSDYALSDLATATVKVRTPSVITFLQINESGIESVIPPTSYNDNQSGGRHWQEVDSITLPDGSIISLPTPQPLVEADEYTSSDPIVIQVRDLDQNLDPNRQETIIVTIEVPGTNDKEVLLLTETSNDSGIFVGVIMTTTASTQLQNGLLTLKDGVKINVKYRDEEDSTDTSATAALVIPNTLVSLSKSADRESVAIGELVRYTLEFRNSSNFTLPLVDINDKLPVGFRYINGSARLNGTKLIQGVTNQARSLTFTLNNMLPSQQWTLEYVAKVTAGVKTGDATNTAQINSGSISSNIARATVEVIDDLMRTKNILTGRIYIGCKSDKEDNQPLDVLEEARIYMETGRSVLSDEEGFWHMEGVEPGAHVLQLDVDSLPKGYEPLLCKNNTRHAGDAKSKFVDLQAGTLWQVDFHVKATKEGLSKAINTNHDLKSPEINPLKKFGNAYLKTAPEGFDILWPANNYVPTVASTKVVVQSSPKHKVEVLLNQKQVSPLNYDGSDTNKARTVTIRRWLGLDLDIKQRDNTLLVIIKDASGKEIARKTRNIHFSGIPASAELLPERSHLIADGKSTPAIAIRVKDEDGFPMRRNTHGYFTLDHSQFQVKTLNDDNDDLNLNESIAGAHKYTIGKDGIALIELNPTTQSGEVKLNLQFSGKKEQPITAWLKPHLREWIVVGLAEGTLAHKSVSGNMETLKDLDKDDSFYKRGRIAFFAKGRIKGKYLLTMAYDTHKKKSEVGSQLDGNIDPDSWYTVYADNSSSQHDAPSSQKLFLKIEKDNFFALFGDYQTGLNVTELSDYERVLSGLKSEYNGRNFSYNGFVSETSNQHQRNEIPGDGTSGLFKLNRDIIPNSETIKIETRDRYHSDRILETRVLTRYQDYDIDYYAGTFYTKFPVNGRDQDFNPLIIVAEYDTESDSNKEITAGGRIAYKTDNEKLEVGLSAIHEGRNQAKNSTLIGTDVTYQITPDTKLHAEYAQTKTAESNNQSRQAYMLELEKEISNMEARLYHKKTESDFGLYDQSSEDGIQKSGAEVKYRMDSHTDITAEISHQKNLENNNTRQLATAGVTRRFEQAEVNLGVRHTKEELDNETIDNNAILAGGSYTTDNGRVTLRSNVEKSISKDDGSETNPDRAVVGIDVNLDHGFTIFAEHETTDNGNIKTHNNRVGVSKPLWKGAKAKTSYTQERTDQGQREYANLGLSQKIKVTEKISADFSIDQSKTIQDNRVQEQFNEDEPVISGSQNDDYKAFTVGLGSDDKDWSWTTRLELRDGEENDKLNFRAGVIRHLEDGKNLSARITHYTSEYENGDFENSTRLTLGSAWHPRNKNFVILNRLDLVDEEDNTSEFTNSLGNTQSGLESHTQKIIHNVHYNRKINDKTQISVHHGIKHVKDSNGSASHETTIDTGMVEVRRDISSKWDIGLHGGYLHDWSEDKVEALAGVSVGVTPMENSWLSVGYNFEGYYDKDFDKSDYTRQGPYVNFRYKFNQDSFDGDLPLRRKKKDKSEKESNGAIDDRLGYNHP